MGVQPPRTSTGGVHGAPKAGARSGGYANISSSGSFKMADPPSDGHLGGANGTGHEMLSEKRAPKLDLSTVERRSIGHTPPDPVRTYKPQGVSDAPTYQPTVEEFADPLAYIRKIAPEARRYGIAKIIPPTGWNPPFSIDTEKFHFRTRKQELNSVEGMTRVNLSYLDQLSKYHKMHGMSLNRFPSVDKKPLDLFRLKQAVELRGGFERVCKGKKWAEIGRDLGYSGKIMSSLSTSLKNSYGRWLQPFEDYLRINKPGVQQQWGMESGSPTVSNHDSQHPHASEERPSSPRTRAAVSSPSPSRPVSRGETRPLSKSTSALNTLVPVGSGFTPVNPGGFIPINNGSGFTPVNGQNAKTHSEKPKAGPLRSKEHQSLNGPDSNGVHHKPILENPLKRPRPSGGETTIEASVHGLEIYDSDAGERRSKRVRRDQPPTVVGSNMALHRSMPVAKGASKIKAIPGEQCDTCGSSHGRAQMISCDYCENVFHKECLNQPGFVKPEEWSCTKCLVGTGEFGFEDGEIYSLSSFQEKANRFKEEFFRSRVNHAGEQLFPEGPEEDQVEHEYWGLVEELEDTVTVEYGADVHSTTHGSGFPTLERNPKDPYARDPWNLNNLPFQADSLFRYIKSDISGMTNPWLYVGMCFSTFCWHNEDHYTYSANYHHFGDTKTWYGIPGEDAEKFEEAMRKAVPDLFERQPDLLFQLVTLLQPKQLQAAGVRVFKADQRAGQFIITFPQAYHAGFNHGFNFNEAVNFAPPDWEPYGQLSVLRLQAFRRSPCFSHNELLITAMSQDTNLKTLRWLAHALSQLRDREIHARTNYMEQHLAAILRLGISCSHVFPGSTSECPHVARIMTEEQTDDQDLSCSFCKADCYLSYVWCRDSRQRYCLDHVDRAEGDHCCGTTEPRLEGRHQFWIRFEGIQLAQMVAKVIERARAPESWEEKYDKVLSEGPNPNLKVLKSLVAEGEKIPFPLAHFSELKRFVERCSEWVEEAIYYITRKQLSRKKNEKSWRRGSARNAEVEEREKELRNVANVPRLLSEAEKIGFDCPEIALLREKSTAIRDWQQEARQAIAEPTLKPIQDLEDMAETGKSFAIDLPEVEELERLAKELNWRAKARSANVGPADLSRFKVLIDEARELAIPDHDRQLASMLEQQTAAQDWESRAMELVESDRMNLPQLLALSSQGEYLPISPDIREKVRGIVQKQQNAEGDIRRLWSATRQPNSRDRPSYKEVRDALELMQSLSTKPLGTVDLERDLKRHEDWMRKGKKLFGKANAPLHILHQHMDYVETRNRACFSLEDKPRTPVEPPSREASPTDSNNGQFAMDTDIANERIYCLCRSREAGMMVECESCRSWYHGKCLKIARGKVKENDKFTCPICDYRVKIPRDAARPRLEELEEWQDEIATLPFRPEEADCLQRIVENAQTFQNHLQPYLNPIMSFSYAEITELRHFLRKLEGADVHLARESNYFKQEIHNLAPVAPDPPPLTEKSLSTRKPRPTKLQKRMTQFGVDDPNDLPEEFRPHKKDVFARDPIGHKPRLEPKSTPVQNGHGHSLSNSLTEASSDGQRPESKDGDYSRDYTNSEGPAFAYHSPGTHYQSGQPEEMNVAQSARFSQNASFGTARVYSPSFSKDPVTELQRTALGLEKHNEAPSLQDNSESASIQPSDAGFYELKEDQVMLEDEFESNDQMVDDLFKNFTKDVDEHREVDAFRDEGPNPINAAAS